ncbi:MAG: hypothetical protein E7426_06455 [Ruminococcaceae bacterium]|jgi:hypothetical protein|nr:hypothetical protein [Oscillospiraceae bacterium]
MITWRRELRRGEYAVCYELAMLGEDLMVCVTGGEAHLGSAVLAVHRPSLRDDGTDSATSGVLNVAGHKDEFMLRELAEKLSALSGRQVICFGGIHYDGLGPEELAQFADMNRQALEEAPQWLAQLRELQ